MAMVFALLFLAAVVGIFKPYIKGWKRRYFGIVAIVCFVAFGIAVPEPTPQELAVKARSEAKVAQGKITDKAREVLANLGEYKREDYPDTYKRVGESTFAMLARLERGAILVAAESKNCDKVKVSGTSDKSTKGAAVFFVDCANGNRFMVNQNAADAAFVRSDKGVLAIADLSPSCTTSSVAMCSASKAQREIDETVAVTFCDQMAEAALISKPDYKWSWEKSFGEEDKVLFARGFTSQNGFGAELKNRYVCTIDAKRMKITNLVIETPFESKSVYTE